MFLLSTSSLKWYGLHKIFKLAKEGWYDGINLDLNSSDFDTENAVYVKEISDSFSLPVVSITAYERKMSQKTVDSIVEMSKILGSQTINFYPPHRLDKDGDWFSVYLPKAKKQNPDIIMNIVNVEPKTFLFFIPEYKDATLNSIKKITGHTALHVSNVDIESWVDLLKTFSVLGNSIANVFLSDKSGSKEELMLGKGDMPLESLLIKLRENGYKGLFTLKVTPKELGAWNDELVIKKLSEAKEYFQKYFK